MTILYYEGGRRFVDHRYTPPVDAIEPGFYEVPDEVVDDYVDAGIGNWQYTEDVDAAPDDGNVPTFEREPADDGRSYDVEVNDEADGGSARAVGRDEADGRGYDVEFDDDGRRLISQSSPDAEPDSDADTDQDATADEQRDEIDELLEGTVPEVEEALETGEYDDRLSEIAERDDRKGVADVAEQRRQSLDERDQDQSDEDGDEGGG